MRAEVEADRLDYVTIVATVAAADGALTGAEVARVRKLVALLGLPERAEADIASATVVPPASVEALKTRLGASPLRHALLADCLLVAQSDGLVQDTEKAELLGIRSELGVTEDEFFALSRYVRSLLGGQPDARALAAIGIDEAALGVRAMLA